MSKRSKSGVDLREAVNQTVIENQRQPTGQQWLTKIDDCLHLYHHDEDLFLGEQLSQRLEAEQGWFEKLVTHAPSVGTFYEDALRAIVSDVLPSKFKVGTGFIFDTTTRRHSRQIDILVYDDSNRAPIYRRGQFVVVPPHLTVAASEVKKKLTLADVRNVIRTSVNTYFGKHPLDPPGCHRLCVFSYSSRSETRRILEEAAKMLAGHIRRFECETISGHKGHFAMCSFVLPQFFFFDRSSTIETELRPRKDGNCDLVISELRTSLQNGLGEYLDHMTMSYDFDEREFRTHALRNIESEAIISSKVYMTERIPIIDLLKRFPNERRNIKNFRVNGQRPYVVLVPAGYDTSTIATFDELKSVPGVSWWTADSANRPNLTE